MGQGRSRGLDDRALRRFAVQIAAQLPENERDAVQVLRYAIELTTGFMEGKLISAAPAPFPRSVPG